MRRGSWIVDSDRICYVCSGPAKALIAYDLPNGDELGQTLSRGPWTAHIIFMDGFFQSGGSAPSSHLRGALSH